MGKSWQVIFESPAKHPDTCATVTVGGQQVAMVWAAITGPGTFKQTCSEPAGRPIYLQHVADECSTFKGDHGSYRTSDAQLKKCAKHEFRNATGKTIVDGQRVPHINSYISASGAYAIDLSQNHNYFGYKKMHGRSAAYGYGVLLTGLSKGTHKIVAEGTIPSPPRFHVKVTYTIHVR